MAAVRVAVGVAHPDRRVAGRCHDRIRRRAADERWWGRSEADDVGGGRAWRWRNLPVPEPHLAGLVVWLILHRVRPRRLGGSTAVRAGGSALVVAGAAMVTWATASAGTNDLDAPDRLITEGAYAHSRNPMYVGWTLAYLGAGALADSAWPVILSPGIAAAMDREVRHEMVRLTARFGADFESYAERVPRYL
jgi:protein-S-isoprenylcysteine O-methyltransferase Ste14